MTDDKWKDINEKVLFALQLSLSPYVLREVMNAKSVAELWKKLEDLYMTKNLANKLHTKEHLYTIRMAEVHLFNHIPMNLILFVSTLRVWT
jgi:hypothetical protein